MEAENPLPLPTWLSCEKEKHKMGDSNYRIAHTLAT